MKIRNRLQRLVVALVVSMTGVPAFPAPPDLSPLPQQAQTAKLATEVLMRTAFAPLPPDDAMSERILERYLKVLDPEKLYFLQSDVQGWQGLRPQLSAAIRDGDLSLPFAIYRLYEQRMGEQLKFAGAHLAQAFDFNRDDSLPLHRDKAPWAATAAELHDLWRKYAKNDWLRLKLAGSPTQSIRRTLAQRYDFAQSRVSRTTSDDVFQVFMDAYTTALDPHTDYLGPQAAEEFAISMKLSLVGIGATLEEKGEYTAIKELMPGGPALRSGKLAVGDRITGVGQGDCGSVSDVAAWRLQDVVHVVRGTKGSEVCLDVLPSAAGPDGPHKRVELVRDMVNVQEQAARKSILVVRSGPNSQTIGVITLPVFYEDFAAHQQGDAAYRSVTRDVSRLLSELKKAKVEGVLIDLRGNGGGSLGEVIRLTGLFVGKGPVVQEQDRQGDVRVDSNEAMDVAWDGPLGVLINRASASASEIFAAAIQDYGRGLILGEQSFGKGTVQSMVDLDALAQSDKPRFGQLKMTVEQFFRVDGSTTQLQGVTPDIALPSFFDTAQFGESSLDNALPWRRIAAAPYRPVGDMQALLPELQRRHAARVKTNVDFLHLEASVAEFQALNRKDRVSLNENERRQERAAEAALLKAQTEHGGHALKETLRADDGLQSSERDLSTELAFEKARKAATDPNLNEAARIVADAGALLRKGRELKVQKPPAAAAATVTAALPQAERP